MKTLVASLQVGVSIFGVFLFHPAHSQTPCPQGEQLQYYMAVKDAFKAAAYSPSTQTCSLAETRTSEAAAVQAALAQCRKRSNASDCVLAAVGDKLQAVAAAKPAAPANLPCSDKEIAAYNTKAEDFKAIAYSPSRNRCFITGGAPSQQDASGAALSVCQKALKVGDCLIIASTAMGAPGASAATASCGDLGETQGKPGYRLGGERVGTCSATASWRCPSVIQVSASAASDDTYRVVDFVFGSTVGRAWVHRTDTVGTAQISGQASTNDKVAVTDCGIFRYEKITGGY